MKILSRSVAILLLLLVGAIPATAGIWPDSVGDGPLPSLAPILDKVTPAVVNVNSRTVVKVGSPFQNDPFFRQFFNLPSVPRERVSQSLGSGVIMDAKRGYVLTNNHVIAGADDISVTLSDGRTFEANLIGTDPDTDVAIIQIPAEDLVQVPFSPPDELRVGDFVVAVGNPFGLGQTVTSGIVSALGRAGVRGLGYQNFIQTDASINPGNSGGPLINLRGELVGINTAIYTPSGGNVGIGFAIPSEMAHKVMTQLIDHGQVQRGTLGVEVQDLDSDLAEALDIKRRTGAVVTRVHRGSPAADSGLKVGDVIAKVDGQSVTGALSFRNIESLIAIGKEIELDYLRNGRTKISRATIREASVNEILGRQLDDRLDGLLLSNIPRQYQREYGESGALINKITRRSGPYRAGLRAGDVITSINREEIHDIDHLRRALKVNSNELLINIRRGRRGYFVVLE